MLKALMATTAALLLSAFTMKGLIAFLQAKVGEPVGEKAAAILDAVLRDRGK